MRHFLFQPLSITALARGMMNPPLITCLIASACPGLRLFLCNGCTVHALDVVATAMATNEHLRMASCAVIKTW
ncbi:MAG: hypothetical protein ACI9W2_001609 [Gammaproteobacteria bacterium]|jgi:hypothetical protein